MSLTAVIIDDEPLALSDLEHELSTISGVSIKGSCRNGVDGIKAIHEHTPDVIFLDIQMPGLNGFEMLSLVDPDKLPRVVFVTAFDEYAVRAFEENALDYILKPVRRDRLEQALERARSEPAADRWDQAAPAIPRAPCRIGRRIRLVPPESVQAAFSDQSGVRLMTDEGDFDTDLTLRTLEQRFGLFRCHKQYVVALAAVKEITVVGNGNAELELACGESVPVSRRFVKPLKQRLGLLP